MSGNVSAGDALQNAAAALAMPRITIGYFVGIEL
jgi:hypothetical protein